MIGYIHIAASGDKQDTPARINIANVSATAYNSVLLPLRLDGLETRTLIHNPHKPMNQHGNLGTLRVLPLGIPQFDRRYLGRIKPENLSLAGCNRTEFEGAFKNRHVTFTLSSLVNINPITVPYNGTYKLDKEVIITFLKYSEMRQRFQQVDLLTRLPALEFNASIAHEYEHSELDYDYWQAAYDACGMKVIVSECDLPLDPVIHVDRLFSQRDREDGFENDIVKTFSLPPPLIDLTQDEDY